MAVQDWSGTTMLAYAEEMQAEARCLLGQIPSHKQDYPVVRECQNTALVVLTEAKLDAESIWAEESRRAAQG